MSPEEIKAKADRAEGKKPAKPQGAGGRPPSYRAPFAKQAEKLCALGATDEDLADFFEVNVRTISRWKVQHEEFCQALKAGKTEADDRVERALYQKAVGYEQDAVKIFMPAGATEPVYAKYREKMAPDTTACIFWLKNRRKDEWRDKLDHEHSGKVDLAPTLIYENVPGQPRKDDGH
jgi:hypothetical protein